MESKMAAVLLLIMFLLCSSVTTSHGARPESASANNLPMAETQNNEGIEAEGVEVQDEGCEALGEEECLMRRVLVAHTDYIYTQEKNP